MATAVVTAESDDHRDRPATPTVVLINCDEAAKYLQPSNDILKHLYGAAPQRLSLTIPTHLTSGDLAMEAIAEIAKEHPDTTWRELDKQINNPTWLANELHANLFDQLGPVYFEGGFRAPARNVRVILAPTKLLDEDGVDNTLYLALSVLFPNATVMEYPGAGKPQPTFRWKANSNIRQAICPSCSTTLIMFVSGRVTCYGCGKEVTYTGIA